jgi:hypothetical protein
MHNPFSKKPKPYVGERDRLLGWLESNDPASPEYETVTKRLNDIDKILNRTSEKFKTLVPAAASVGAIGALYAVQQFGGIIVPKAAEALAARNTQKNHKED